MKRLVLIGFSIVSLLGCEGRTAEGELADSTIEQARSLGQEIIILDTHIDVPYRLKGQYEDISERTVGGEFAFVNSNLFLTLRSNEGKLLSLSIAQNLTPDSQEILSTNLSDLQFTIAIIDK